MSTILVGTYNMSFAGDQALDPNRPGVFESEAAFHMSNKSGDLRQFWKNALANVEMFVSESTAGYIGFQEINKTADGSDTGSGALKSAIMSKKPSFAVVTEEVVLPFGKPAITIAWDTAKLGNEEKHHIVDLDYVPSEPNTNKQAGRPMLMVLTNKGYLLVSLHAPNYPPTYTGEFPDLRNAINNNIKTFLENKTVEGSKVFIVGDFNDRFDALQDITLNDGTDLKYLGQAPRSCCHNWDSSCSDARFSKKEGLSKRNGRADIGSCRVPTYKEMMEQGKLTVEDFTAIVTASTAAANKAEANGKPRPKVIAETDTIALAGPGKRFLLGAEGNIENYRYYSDKVFGADPAENIHIFPKGRAGASTQSDHEMVVAEFNIPRDTAGGRRRKSSKTHRKAHRRTHRRTHRKQSKKARRNH
jgi:hypothetical protein